MDGRGRYYRWNKRDTTAGYLQLKISDITRFMDLERYSYSELTWHMGEDKKSAIAIQAIPGQGLQLIYSYQGQPVAPYTVRLDATQPNYGGRRYWFLCPGCGRRCSILYSGRLFQCRECLGLTYETAQSGGDLIITIRNRLAAVRRKLQAKKTPAWEIPQRPPRMHLRTYDRLVSEYMFLVEMEDQVINLELAQLVGDLAWGEEEPNSAELQRLAKILEEDTTAAWADYRANRVKVRPSSSYRWHMGALGEPFYYEEPSQGLTLGELATAAGVPFSLAKDAQAQGLLKPDSGRGGRRKRYRRRLASWVAKLGELRGAGYSWEEIRAWVDRRFQPGHENERRYPADYGPKKEGG